MVSGKRRVLALPVIRKEGACMCPLDILIVEDETRLAETLLERLSRMMGEP